MTTVKKDSLASSVARYSTSHMYRFVLGGFSALIKPKLLSPELFGLWNILSIIPKYASFLHLGANDVMKFRIPYHLSRKEDAVVSEMRDSAYYGALYVNLPVVVGLLLLALFYEGEIAIRVGFGAMAVMVILSWYYDYYIDLLKAYQDFRLVSAANYLRTTVALLTTLCLIYFFKIYGLYAAVILTFASVILFVRSRYRVTTSHSRFRFSAFKGLVRAGFPILIFGIITEFIISSDQIVISYYLGLEQLGYYGITKLFVEFLMQIPRTSREVVEPRMMEDLAESSGETILANYFFKPLYNTAYFMPLIIGPVILLLPVAIPLLLPRYSAGIQPTQIVALGCYFLGLAFVIRGIIVAQNWQVKALIILGPVLVANVLLSIALIFAGFGLNGVAFASSFSYFLLFVCLLVFVRCKSDIAYQGWLQNSIGLFWPFPFMCLVLAAVNSLSENLPVNVYLQTLVDLFLYALCLGIFLFWAQGRYPLLKRIQLKLK